MVVSLNEIKCKTSKKFKGQISQKIFRKYLYEILVKKNHFEIDIVEYIK